MRGFILSLNTEQRRIPEWKGSCSLDTLLASMKLSMERKPFHFFISESDLLGYVENDVSSVNALGLPPSPLRNPQPTRGGF